MQKLIEAAIKYTFDGDSGFMFFHSQLGQSLRGELCASVALLALWLLDKYGVGARLVFGSARWNSYPVAFIWKGQAEYHAWVETEYGELVDLACDAINQRSNISLVTKMIPPPRNCWDKPDQIPDRVYTEVPYEGQTIDMDLPDSPQFKKFAEVALTYAEIHKQEFRKRFDT